MELANTAILVVTGLRQVSWPLSLAPFLGPCAGG
jgi:hypothetical protein